MDNDSDDSSSIDHFRDDEYLSDHEFVYEISDDNEFENFKSNILTEVLNEILIQKQNLNDMIDEQQELLDALITDSDCK